MLTFRVANSDASVKRSAAPAFTTDPVAHPTANDAVTNAAASGTTLWSIAATRRASTMSTTSRIRPSRTNDSR